MSPFWLAFAAGLFIGTFIGVIIMSLLIIGRKR